MSTELEYSVTITGASFLFYELKQVIGLKLQGLKESEIKEKVSTENLFQYQAKSSIKRSLPSVLRRVNELDKTLCQMVVEHSLNSGKIINLYAIMKTDRLFFEFMSEVIQEKFQSNNYLLERKDLNLYITSKAEQNALVAAWTEQTITRLKQVYVKVLHDSGLLKDKESGELSRPMIDEQLKAHLIQIGDIAYVRAMGEV
ncbi:hypothetical protein BSK66_10150 [Paenibacillus odorifer]|uniref:DUF1819 domain-containing protein n=1 Tax=Paenibacillus odorifer TaxID=189426 RepID=A0A1R0XDS2_9BACL|nr:MULTISPECIES: DUF1819 family protein [Paenibacillus]ETT45416.1 hypothetical protein C171_32006 [Paenibacillus sp. FSL H8-237]OMD33221.1 hypothetical protein BJP51_12735 [Paenibacillus odorifer]OME59700.1 hypothetical protein BSK66_10150 [Paenibacillus odorifer]